MHLCTELLIGTYAVLDTYKIVKIMAVDSQPHVKGEPPITVDIIQFTDRNTAMAPVNYETVKVHLHQLQPVTDAIDILRVEAARFTYKYWELHDKMQHLDKIMRRIGNAISALAGDRDIPL